METPAIGQPGSAQPAYLPYLKPDHHPMPAGADPAPGDLEQSLAGERTHTRIVWWAKLLIDRQAEDVAVEAAAAVQVARAQEDPVAENIHATIPAPQ